MPILSSPEHREFTLAQAKEPQGSWPTLCEDGISSAPRISVDEERFWKDARRAYKRLVLEPELATGSRVPGLSELGHYRVLELLGEGGMGQVYRAEHIYMRRVVALKLIAPALVRDATALNRFRTEVELAGRLNHPNIVVAHDAAEAGGRHFLVMEYVRGLDLGRLVKENGPLPLLLACQCIRQAALGLQHAHEMGLVHRDVKPANILVQLDDRVCKIQHKTLPGAPTPGCSPPELPAVRVKLSDFGLARLVDTCADNPTLFTSSGYMSGLGGTPDYIAPEHARDVRTFDIRSDLYGLGCTFFYVLTGQVPYPAGNWAEKLLRHQFDPIPDVRRLRPEIPPELALVLTKLLAKTPESRFQTPLELVCELDDFLLGGGSSQQVDRTAGVETQSTNRDVLRTTSPAMSKSTAASLPGLANTSVSEWPEAKPPATAWLDRPPAAGSRSLRARRLVAISAIAAGLIMAGFSRQYWQREDPAPETTIAAPAEAPLPVATRLVKADAGQWMQKAIDAAADGDTLVIEPDGVLDTEPIRIANKRLTIRALSGRRVHLKFSNPNVQSPWQPLIWSNSSLILEGIEIHCQANGANKTAHLVYTEGSELVLRQCRLIALNGRCPVVCRRARRVQVSNCEIAAQTGAICVEGAPAQALSFTVETSQVRAVAASGAAIVVWPEEERKLQCSLELRQNQIDAGRLLVFTGKSASTHLHSSGNTFRFSQAMVAWAGGESSGSALKRMTWRGQDNHYYGTSSWILADNESLGIDSLDQWRRFWHAAETGSTAENPLQQAASAKTLRQE